MTVPVKHPAAGDIMEAVIAKGDLARLTPEERVRYYNEVCRSMGLNALTQPFSYITLNGKLTLYATRACADQLRKVNGVSLEIVSREIADDILSVHVRAKLPDGRVDEDLGAVAFPATLKGEARVNAELKAVTKAKRRATLSICGLGWLDETEIETIPASAKRPAPPAPSVLLPPEIEPTHNPQTGEIIEAADTGQSAPAAPPVETSLSAAGAALSLQDMAREAAQRGRDVFDTFYKTRNRQEQAALRAMKAELEKLMPAPADTEQANELGSDVAKAVLVKERTK